MLTRCVLRSTDASNSFRFTTSVTCALDLCLLLLFIGIIVDCVLVIGLATFCVSPTLCAYWYNNSIFKSRLPLCSVKLYVCIAPTTQDKILVWSYVKNLHTLRIIVVRSWSSINEIMSRNEKALIICLLMQVIYTMHPFIQMHYNTFSYLVTSLIKTFPSPILFLASINATFCGLCNCQTKHFDIITRFQYTMLATNRKATEISRHS